MKKTKFNNGHRWTDDELKVLMALWADGKTPNEIATILNETSQYVFTQYGISKMVVRLRQQGIPLERRRRGHQVGQRSGKPWTQEEVEYLARRRMDGATSEDIGISLGRTHHAVAAMIANLRAEDVPIAMMGNGVRKLWNPDVLRRALLHSDPKNVDVIRLDERRDEQQKTVTV